MLYIARLLLLLIHALSCVQKEITQTELQEWVPFEPVLRDFPLLRRRMIELLDEAVVYPEKAIQAEKDYRCMYDIKDVVSAMPWVRVDFSACKLVSWSDDGVWGPGQIFKVRVCACVCICVLA